jgi:hypothetical protein
VAILAHGDRPGAGISFSSIRPCRGVILRGPGLIKTPPKGNAVQRPSPGINTDHTVPSAHTDRYGPCRGCKRIKFEPVLLAA